MRVAVVGSGGIGGYFGALLVRAGVEVTFLARGAHLAAMRERGLEIQSVPGNFAVRVDATHDPAGLGQPDLILFAVKGYDTAEAAALLRPAVGPATALLSLQNGVDNEEILQDVLGRERVLGGVVHILSTISAPGVIAQTAGPRRITFGELDGRRTERVERIFQLLSGAEIPTRVSADIRVDLWEKFLFICAHGGVTAITRLGIGEILACPETAALYRAVMEEIGGVARGKGIPLPHDAVERALAFAGSLAPAMRSSLAHDLERGHRLEIETLPGAVVRYGREAGVPTPLCQMLYACLKPHHLRALAARGGQPAASGA